MTDRPQSELAHALEMRRRVLGADYVERATSGQDDAGRDFQDAITRQAWSVWTRPGLASRDRSLLVLAMTGALGRMDEFELHVRSAENAGVLDTEIDELLLQMAAYCGAPAAVSARKVVLRIRRERDR